MRERPPSTGPGLWLRMSAGAAPLAVTVGRATGTADWVCQVVATAPAWRPARCRRGTGPARHIGGGGAISATASGRDGHRLSGAGLGTGLRSRPAGSGHRVFATGAVSVFGPGAGPRQFSDLDGRRSASPSTVFQAVDTPRLFRVRSVAPMIRIVRTPESG